MKDLKKIIIPTFCLTLCFLFFSIKESSAQVKEMSAVEPDAIFGIRLFEKAKTLGWTVARTYF